MLHALRHAPGDVARRCAGIHKTVVALTGTSGDDVRALDTAVLKRLFADYDREFFDGLINRMLREDDAGEVVFRTSGRMTRAAGKTIRMTRRPRPGGLPVGRSSYEIAISTTLLRESFRGDGRGRVVTVGGLPCLDWVSALQRVFEHELLHLAEFLGWGQSRCAGENFKSLSFKVFGHETSHHDLVTPREQAAEVHGVRPGDLVSFRLDGSRFVGRVNRITKRATVLVDDPGGRPYSDGRRYAAYYVPLGMLSLEPGSA